MSLEIQVQNKIQTRILLTYKLTFAPRVEESLKPAYWINT